MSPECLAESASLCSAAPLKFPTAILTSASSFGGTGGRAKHGAKSTPKYSNWDAALTFIAFDMAWLGSIPELIVGIGENLAR